MEEAQLARARTSGRQQTLVDAAAEAAGRLSLIAADPARLSHAAPQQRLSSAGQRRESLQNVAVLRTSAPAEQHLLEVEETRKVSSHAHGGAHTSDWARQAAARISSRASVVVQLAARRQQAKPKAREQLYEASDRVARALAELAQLETARDPDLDQLQRLVAELDDEQALLFGALPAASPSLRKRDASLRESVRKSVARGTAVQKFYAQEKGDREPGPAVLVAREKVEETLRELDELENDKSAADDELAVLVEEGEKGTWCADP